MLLNENQNRKKLNANVNKSFHKFEKEKPTNYAIFLPDSRKFEMGECLNIDKTLSTFRRTEHNLEVIALI